MHNYRYTHLQMPAHGHSFTLKQEDTLTYHQGCLVGNNRWVMLLSEIFRNQSRQCIYCCDRSYMVLGRQEDPYDACGMLCKIEDIALKLFAFLNWPPFVSAIVKIFLYKSLPITVHYLLIINPPDQSDSECTPWGFSTLRWWMVPICRILTLGRFEAYPSA